MSVGTNAAKAAEGADVIVTDTWVSMGDADKDARDGGVSAVRGDDDAMMARAAKDAVFLHCLPAHRGEEVTDAVIDGRAIGGVGRSGKPHPRAESCAAVVSREIVTPPDDLVAPFSLDMAPVRGRIARSSVGAIDPILRRHDYPRPSRCCWAKR